MWLTNKLQLNPVHPTDEVVTRALEGLSVTTCITGVPESPNQNQ